METIHGETGLRIEEDHQEEVDHREAEDHPEEDNLEEEVHQETEDHPEVEDLLAEDHLEDHLGRSPGCLGVRRKEKKATKLIFEVCLLSRALEPGNLHSEMN